MSGFQTEARNCNIKKPIIPKSYKIAIWMARGLLLCALVMITGCPYPDFQIDPEENTPIDVRDELLLPPEGIVSASRTCPSSPVEFMVGPAVEDPDGDTLHSFWYVNYEEGTGSTFRDSGTLDFLFDPCTDPDAAPGGSVLVELILMDHPPAEFTTAGARTTTGDGDLVRFVWVVDIAEGGECCGL